MSASTIESKRVRAFRLGIVKEISKFPNDRQTKKALEQKSLGDLFITYINWACRYVPPRIRKVALAPPVTSDSRWGALRSAINEFLDKVRNGEDLMPHLSLLAHKHGFSLSTAAKTPSVDRWADKDFLLNVMGYHHFHLGLILEPAGHVKRSNEVLFAAITRDHFEALAIFDHSVFEQTDAVTNMMTAERHRLWDIFMVRSNRGMPAGTVYASAMIMTSGHCYPHVALAFDFARIVRELDPKLDDIVFVKGMYEEAKITPPARPKLKWHLNYLDWGLIDESQKAFFVLRYGPT